MNEAVSGALNDLDVAVDWILFRNSTMFSSEEVRCIMLRVIADGLPANTAEFRTYTDASSIQKAGELLTN